MVIGYRLTLAFAAKPAEISGLIRPDRSRSADNVPKPWLRCRRILNLNRTAVKWGVIGPRCSLGPSALQRCKHYDTVVIFVSCLVISFSDLKNKKNKQHCRFIEKKSKKSCLQTAAALPVTVECVMFSPSFYLQAIHDGSIVFEFHYSAIMQKLVLNKSISSTIHWQNIEFICDMAASTHNKDFFPSIFPKRMMMLYPICPV